MSFSRMKPLPKFLIIAVGVAGVVWAASFVMSKMPAKAPEVKADPVTTTSVPAESAQPAPAPSAAQPAPPPVATAPAPEPSAPALQPAPSNDAGLANVLGGKK